MSLEELRHQDKVQSLYRGWQRRAETDRLQQEGRSKARQKVQSTTDWLRDPSPACVDAA